MIFRSQANKTHFHEKCCALSLTLKVRVFGTRKWPIALARKLGSMLLTCNNISPDWDKQHINQGFCFLFLPSPNNNSLWKQSTFHEAATGFPAKWRLRKERAQKCHTRLRALVHHTSFRGETSGGVAKCRLFSQATAISFTMFQATSSGSNVAFVFYKNTFSRSMRMKKVNWPSLRSRRLEVVGARKNGRARRRHPSRVSLARVRSLFRPLLPGAYYAGYDWPRQSSYHLEI